MFNQISQLMDNEVQSEKVCKSFLVMDVFMFHNALPCERMGDVVSMSGTVGSEVMGSDEMGSAGCLLTG